MKRHGNSSKLWVILNEREERRKEAQKFGPGCLPFQK
jgi:hypothetical protein